MRLLTHGLTAVLGVAFFLTPGFPGVPGVPGFPGIQGAGVARADDAAPPKEEQPRQLIDRLSHEVLGILADKGLTTQDKQLKIQDIAFANIDFPIVSRLTLGRHWNELNDAQRQDFMKEYRAHLSNTYRGMIDNYHNEQIVVTGDRDENRGDKTVITKITDPDSSDQFKAEYRLRHEDGGWKIIDVTIEGVSLVSNFRSQFEEIISNGGFDQLMTMLRKKNAEAATETSDKK